MEKKSTAIRKLYAQGLSPQEIAAKLGVKISTVYSVRYLDKKKARIRRAKPKDVDTQDARDAVLKYIETLQAENRDLKAVIRYLEGRHGASI